MEKRKMWIVAGSVASIALLAGFMLPFEAYLGLVAVVFLLAATAVGLIVQMEKPVLGLVLMVATAVALPVEFRGPSGVMMGSSFPLAAALCGVWMLRFAVVRDTDLDASRVVYATFLFMGVTLLSFAMGQFPWFASGGAPLPAQIVEVGLFVLSGCLFLAVGHQIKSIEHLKWLTWMLVAAGTVTCILQMAPSLRFIARWTTRPGSVGSLFWTWLVAVCFAQALFNRRLSVVTRMFLLGVTALVLYHGLFQVRSWASGWLPALVAMGVIVVVRIPRISLGLGFVGLPIGLFLAPYITTFLMGDEQYSLSTRTEAWSVLWNLVMKSPLLGTGPANYYYFTENFPIMGWYVRFISHNNYQDLLVQTGLAGLLAFCWLAFEMFLMLVRLFRQAPSGFAKAYVVGAIGGLAGSLAAGMLGDWIIPFYYNAGILGFRSSLLFWVFLGGVLALKRIVASPAAAGALSHAPARPFPLRPRRLVEAH